MFAVHSASDFDSDHGICRPIVELECELLPRILEVRDDQVEEMDDLGDMAVMRNGSLCYLCPGALRVCEGERAAERRQLNRWSDNARDDKGNMVVI